MVWAILVLLFGQFLNFWDSDIHCPSIMFLEVWDTIIGFGMYILKENRERKTATILF